MNILRNAVWFGSLIFVALLVATIMDTRVLADDADGNGGQANVEGASAEDAGEDAPEDQDGAKADSTTTDNDYEEKEEGAVSARLGEDVVLEDRFFRRPRDFFMRSAGGERFQQHYERFNHHQENVPTEAMSPAEAQAYQAQRLQVRPVYDLVGYEAGAQSVRVWIPEGFDEEEIAEWGLFLYVSSDDAPDVPADLRDILTEHKMIFAAPNGAGKDKPDVLRIALILDTLNLMQTTYRRMHRRKTMVYGEGEAGQMALLAVMNFPDRFKNCAVVPVDTSLTMTLRYQAGSFERVGRLGTTQTIPYYHPIAAPYLSPTEYRKMRGVTVLSVLTSRSAINDHYARIMDWAELSGDRRFRPFWYPDGLTAEGMGVLLQALEGRRQVLDTDAIPEELLPVLETDRR